MIGDKAFFRSLENPEIGSADEIVFIPGIGLPGPHINEGIGVVEIDEQKKIAFILISGYRITLAHLNTIYSAGIIFLQDV